MFRIHSVRIHNGKDLIEMKAADGASLYELLVSCVKGMDTPCGGKGTCGKCKVRVEAKGRRERLTAAEKRLLGDSVPEGCRLACYVRVNSDIDVYADAYPDAAKRGARILTEGRARQTVLGPVVSKVYIESAKPGLDDQRSDLNRITDAAGKTAAGGFVSSPRDFRNLPDMIRKNGFKVTGVYMNGKPVSFEDGDTAEKLCGVAVDIGTTTVAAYLYDLSEGRMLGAGSMLNPQIRYGADVVSRIQYAANSQAALDEVHHSTVACMNTLISSLSKSARIRKNHIYLGVFAGNTTMMHFLMGISPSNIATAPFIPVTTGMHLFKAREIGIGINRSGYAAVLPGVSAYIGADTVAAVLSTGMYDDDRLTLLVDIGTNGEIVLGSRNRMMACSTAAGPAFEGANIKYGSAGVEGAIDTVRFGETLEYTTIGNKPAIGICGSGVVDTVAGMLDRGMIDGTGRFLSADEAAGCIGTGALSAYYSERIVLHGGMPAFRIAEAKDTAIDSDIVITQKDVRELQNAKAAIHAGIVVLTGRYGVAVDDIEKVWLAGGFGTYMDIGNALKIGLLPQALIGRIESVGNAAGAGAVEALLSKRMLDETEKIAKRIEHLELSGLPDFAVEYVNSMIFWEASS